MKRPFLSRKFSTQTNENPVVEQVMKLPGVPSGNWKDNYFRIKRSLLLSMILVFAIFSGCGKSGSTNISPALYNGVVILRGCNYAVIQTLGSPNYIGQDTWVTGANTYHHVFRVQNWCQFGNHAMGDTVWFRVVQPQTQNCVACMMLANAPETTIPITIY